MNAAQRYRHAALLRSAGYEDAAPLTSTSSDGALPQGRELSLAWLSGTILTGFTSVLLMAGALYVSFQGQDTFSTPFEALAIQRPTVASTNATSPFEKTRRTKPVTETRSERQVIEASIREVVDGVARIRNQPFVHIEATLATAATSLSDEIPSYDPVALLARNEPLRAESGSDFLNTDIYGTDVEGEIAVATVALPLSLVPAPAINDSAAAQFVRVSVEGAYTVEESPLLGYAAMPGSLDELDPLTRDALTGVAENVTVLPMTRTAEEAGIGRTERIVTLRERTDLSEALMLNGFSPSMVTAVTRAIRNVYSNVVLPQGARLRIQFGPSRGVDYVIPYRMSIYIGDQHQVTVALSDSGSYVLGVAPPAITFPEEDTEEVAVSNLPSIYRSIWETGRKHALDDATIDRIAAMFAYEVDLTRRVSPGDTIDLLLSEPDAEGAQELLYVGLTLGNTTREMFRFRTDDGEVDYYNAEGETGQQFLLRRPLEGGGTLRSRYGGRTHPIYGDYRVHTGVDLAAPSGTPIYAAGDGVVEMAQWYSGYGRYVELRHANSYGTAYGHMSAIADGITPGTVVRQGQVIGYVGTTGQSTGPHLHFEIKINGNTTDPLSVRLPRANSLDPQYLPAFSNSVAQIRSLLANDQAPLTVAASSP